MEPMLKEKRQRKKKRLARKNMCVAGGAQ